MTDLFLITMAIVNSLLLLVFYRTLHVKAEAKNKIFLIVSLRYLKHRQHA